MYREFLLVFSQRFRRNDLTLTAQAVLVLMINKKLVGTASPRLLINRSGEPQGFLCLHHLLAAMWVQLSQVVLDNVGFWRAHIAMS